MEKQEVKDDAVKKREADSLTAIINDSIMAAQKKDIMETAAQYPELSVFIELLTAAGIDHLLSDSTANFTLFAPINSCFKSMDQEQFNALKTSLKKKQDLTDLLAQHISSGIYSTAALQGKSSLLMLSEKELEITETENLFKISGVTLDTTDVYCSNGVIHIISEVLK
jgi:solute carrier family 25 carnitine/acylcarnitine transporter 20/29